MTVQVWAEVIRDKGILKILQRGLEQPDSVTKSLAIAQAKELLPQDLDQRDPQSKC